MILNAAMFIQNQSAGIALQSFSAAGDAQQMHIIFMAVLMNLMIRAVYFRKKELSARLCCRQQEMIINELYGNNLYNESLEL